MFKKILTHSIRALRRQKSYVFINIVGLATGIACSLVIALFIVHELSYDQYHEHKDRIHRVVLHGKIGGQELRGGWTPAPMGPTMAEEFPEVEAFLRLNEWSETVIRYEDRAFTEDHFVEADSSFFDFFSVRLLDGDPKTALTEPFTLVLSASTAEKIFGDENPMGKMLRVGTGTTLYAVTGVMEDIPDNSHFSANIIGSFVTSWRASNTDWLSNNLSTYVMLHPAASADDVDARFYDLVLKYAGDEIRRFIGTSIEEFLAQGNIFNYFTQPLTNIHLNPEIENPFQAANDPRYLWIFGSIGFLILVIASINFMNLSTAQATRRAKEVGIKKVSGASKGSLIRQFLVETVILAFFALLLAVVIVELAIPYLGNLLDTQLRMGYLDHWYTIPMIVVFTCLIGIFAGSYPAFYLSSFDPNAVLKGNVSGSRNTMTIRSALTVLQFAISIILVVGTLVMYRQLHYMMNKDLGFDQEHVLVIRRAGALGDQGNSFKAELKNIPGVAAVSFSTAVPGHSNNNNGYTMPGRPDESFILQTNWVDYDFLETYGLHVTSGRFFDPELLTDREACLINDMAVRKFLIDDPLTARFQGFNQVSDEPAQLPVIGTFGDFHFESMRQDIGPYMFQFRHDQIQWGFVSIRLLPSATGQVLQEIENTWASFTANDPMLYFFMDEDFRRMYREEQRNASLSVIFTILAIIIASLGLFGLTSFNVAQRTKEIGVRKTFGASVFDVWRLISKDIIVLVAIATAIAWPIIYWVAANWLENYHYRISLSPVDFFTGFVIAVIIALITISYRTIRAASVNPSVTLKYE